MVVGLGCVSASSWDFLAFGRGMESVAEGRIGCPGGNGVCCPAAVSLSVQGMKRKVYVRKDLERCSSNVDSRRIKNKGCHDFYAEV